MLSTKRAYLFLHLAVFLWGFTAILGDQIHLSALSLVWWRVFLTSLSLLFIVRTGRALRSMPRKSVLQFAFVGVVTGLHWVTFYGAIKLSNASVTLVCMATCAFFTSLIEPLIIRSHWKWWEVLTGFLIIPGMALIVENVEVSMRAGIWVGLLSSFLAAVFSILNKKWIQNAEPMDITFIEMTSAWLFLSLILPFWMQAEPETKLLPTWRDLGLLLVLALFCTTFTWWLSLKAMKRLSAFAANLTINMEPVYGIFLAWALLREDRELSPGFYWGVLLIMVVVFSYPIINKVAANRKWDRQPEKKSQS